MSKFFSKIRFIVAVAAGKGGVGKSSMTVNLALAFRAMGYEVGVLDGDLYGPSLGHMMPLEIPLKKSLGESEGCLPGEFQGVKVFSLSQIRSDQHPMSVRAPVVNGLVLEMVKDVVWGELDYLFVDFPPGTGDIQLTLLQSIPFSGAVIITMPNEVSVIDVKKAAMMFRQSDLPILGVIENMSYFFDPLTSEKRYLFGEGGGEKIANAFGIPFFGGVPLDPDLCKAGDLGKNFMQEQEQGATALKIREISSNLKEVLFTLESLKGDYLREFELVWEEK